MTRIYVDIDCLFDTRLGLVSQLSPTALDQIDIDEYKSRPIDGAPYIPLVGFSELYSKRDKGSLFNSVQTELMKGLGEIALELEKNRIGNPTIDQTKFIINFAPYDLTEEEMDTVCEGILDILPPFCEISRCVMTREDITPTFLQDNVDSWYTYDFNEWLIVQEENLREIRTPTVSIMTPKLFAGKIGEDDMFTAVEYGLAQSFKLHYQPVSHYSILLE